MANLSALELTAADSETVELSLIEPEKVSQELENVEASPEANEKLAKVEGLVKVETSSTKSKAVKVAAIVGLAALSALAFYEFSHSDFNYTYSEIWVEDFYRSTLTTKCIGNWFKVHSLVTGGDQCLFELEEWFKMYRATMFYTSAFSGMYSLIMLKNLTFPQKKSVAVSDEV